MKVLILFILVFLIILIGLIFSIILFNKACFIYGFILLLITIFGGIKALEWAERRKHPNCNTICNATGTAGSEYKQFYCKKCKETFYLKLFIDDGKIY